MPIPEHAKLHAHAVLAITLSQFIICLLSVRHLQLHSFSKAFSNAEQQEACKGSGHLAMTHAGTMLAD